MSRAHFFIIIGMFLVSGKLLAAQSARVLSISSTGKSIILDRGKFERVAQGQYVKFVKKSGDLNRPKLTFVADAESLRVTDKKSYWLLRKMNPSESIIEGDELFMIPIKEINEGRTELKIGQKKVIMREGVNELDYVKELKKGVPASKVKYEQDYHKDKKQVKTEAPIKDDIETTEYDDWKKEKDLVYIDEYMNEFETKRVQKLNSRVDKEYIRKREEKIRFDSIVKGVMSKVNSNPDGLKGLYRDQERDEDIDELKKRIDIKNSYEMAQEKRNNRIIHPTVYEKKKREGELWPSKFSDDELRQYVVKSGIEKEHQRLSNVFNEQKSNEIFLMYGSGVSDNTTSEDPSHRGKISELMIAYEYHFLRSTEKFKSLSLEGGLERGKSFYALGTLNAKFSYNAFHFALNWYFINNPGVLDKYMWYLGMGLKSGTAEVGSNTLSQDYTYTMTTLPLLHIGMKYRFMAGDSYSDSVKVGAGVHFRLSSERTVLSSSDFINETQTVETDLIYTDYKFSFGFSLYF